MAITGSKAKNRKNNYPSECEHDVQRRKRKTNGELLSSPMWNHRRADQKTTVVSNFPKA